MLADLPAGTVSVNLTYPTSIWDMEFLLRLNHPYGLIYIAVPDSDLIFIEVQRPSSSVIGHEPYSDICIPFSGGFDSDLSHLFERNMGYGMLDSYIHDANPTISALSLRLSKTNSSFRDVELRSVRAFVIRKISKWTRYVIAFELYYRVGCRFCECAFVGKLNGGDATEFRNSNVSVFMGR